MVNLQKSQWGGRCYIKVALWIKDIGEVVDPPQHKCHIRTRLETLDPQPCALAAALDMSSGLDGQLRAAAVQRSLDGCASGPPFASCSAGRSQAGRRQLPPAVPRQPRGSGHPQRRLGALPNICAAHKCRYAAHQIGRILAAARIAATCCVRCQRRGPLGDKANHRQRALHQELQGLR